MSQKIMQREDKKTRVFQKAVFKTTAKIVIIVLLTASVLINLFTFVTPVVEYCGSSMSPTLEDGQILVVSKVSDIEVGDIVAFYYNNKVLVRRVIATGSQQVSVDVFGTVTVNGEELDEDYIDNKTLGQCNLDFPYTVPVNTLFVLGDNRAVAMDSRLEEIGTVSEDRLIGKVVFSIYPFGSIE